MKSGKVICIAALLALIFSACSATEPELESQPVKVEESSNLPTPIAECIETEIVDKIYRLWDPKDPKLPKREDAIGKEIVLKLPNKMFLYTEHFGDTFLASANFAAGNPVQLCLVALPTDCPPGDDRGKRYSLLDRRTGFSGIYVDAWHLCGGA